MLTPHGMTLTITPPQGLRPAGSPSTLLDRIARCAASLGIQILSARTTDDGRSQAVVLLDDVRGLRGTTDPVHLAEPLKLLSQILYHSLPAHLRPDGLPSGVECTPATLLWRAGMDGRPLSHAMALSGIASQPGDPLALSLCPVLLFNAGLLPDGVTIHAALTRLSFLLAAGAGKVRMGDQIMDTILVPGQLVRAMISEGGNLAPSPVASALVA